MRKGRIVFDAPTPSVSETDLAALYAIEGLALDDDGRSSDG
jgi:hypothetical protein